MCQNNQNINQDFSKQWWKDTLELDEIKVVRPPKTWNLNKPGINADLIKPGDIIEFIINNVHSHHIAKQKFIRFFDPESPNMYVTRDIEKLHLSQDEGGWDYWTKHELENYYKNNIQNEIKIFSKVTPETVSNLFIKIRDNTNHGIVSLLSKYGYYFNDIDARYLSKEWNKKIQEKYNNNISVYNNNVLFDFFETIYQENPSQLYLLYQDLLKITNNNINESVSNDDYVEFINLLKQNQDKIRGGYGEMIKVGVSDPKYYKELVDTLLSQIKDSYSDSERVFGKEVTDLAKKIHQSQGIEGDELNKWKKQVGLSEIRIANPKLQELIKLTTKINNIVDKLGELNELYGKRGVFSRYVRGASWGISKIDLNINSGLNNPLVIDNKIKRAVNTLKLIKKQVREAIKSYYNDKHKKYNLNMPIDHGVLKLKQLYQNHLGGKEIFSENEEQLEDIRLSLFKQFKEFAYKQLELSPSICNIILTNDKTKTKTYAHYDSSKKEIVVYIKNRSVGDVCRSLSHELVHLKQDLEGKLNQNSGETGSPQENEANSLAGIILRKFGEIHPEIFTESKKQEGKLLNEIKIISKNSPKSLLLKLIDKVKDEYDESSLEFFRNELNKGDYEAADIYNEILTNFVELQDEFKFIDLNFHKKSLNEIKILKPTPNFPDNIVWKYNIRYPELLKPILKKLKSLEYTWVNGDEINIEWENYIDKNHFPVVIYKPNKEKSIFVRDTSDDHWDSPFLKSLNEIEKSFSKQWWKDTLKLDEIGEMSFTFNYESSGEDPEGNILYSFNTPENQYTVAFNLIDDGVYERYFNTLNGSVDSNEGIASKVISTITKITIDFLNKYNPEEISIHPIKSGDEQGNRRQKISLLFLNKNIDKTKYNIINTPNSIRILKK